MILHSQTDAAYVLLTTATVQRVHTLRAV